MAQLNCPWESLSRAWGLRSPPGSFPECAGTERTGVCTVEGAARSLGDSAPRLPQSAGPGSWHVWTERLAPSHLLRDGALVSLLSTPKAIDGPLLSSSESKQVSQDHC